MDRVLGDGSDGKSSDGEDSGRPAFHHLRSEIYLRWYDGWRPRYFSRKKRNMLASLSTLILSVEGPAQPQREP
jgi:hypothetical protein